MIGAVAAGILLAAIPLGCIWLGAFLVANSDEIHRTSVFGWPLILAGAIIGFAIL